MYTSIEKVMTRNSTESQDRLQPVVNTVRHGMERHTDAIGRSGGSGSWTETGMMWDIGSRLEVCFQGEDPVLS